MWMAPKKKGKGKLNTKKRKTKKLTIYLLSDQILPRPGKSPQFQNKQAAGGLIVK